IARVHEEASSFNVDEWEDIQATIEADEELALRIQAEEREKYYEAEKARLLTGESSEPRGKEDDELTQEDLQQMMMMVSVEEFYVEALQTGYLDWYKGKKKSKKIFRVAANVFGEFNKGMHQDTPFDMEFENGINVGQRGELDLRMVAAVCQEVMRMFKGKNVAQEESTSYHV
nr:hypothetical protein [Tanacetum cinerariifolium]